MMCYAVLKLKTLHWNDLNLSKIWTLWQVFWLLQLKFCIEIDEICPNFTISKTLACPLTSSWRPSQLSSRPRSGASPCWFGPWKKLKMFEQSHARYLTFFFLFYVRPPKDIFFDHLLWSIFQSSSHNTYHKLPAGPLRAVSV